MSKLWAAVGGLVALVGLALMAWALWWVPPVGTPLVPPPLVPPPAPPVSPLGQAIAGRQAALDACLGHWQRTSADAPAVAVLQVLAAPVAEGQGYTLEVAVPGEGSGRLVLEACAAAAIQDLATLVTEPEALEIRVGGTTPGADPGPPAD